MKQQKRIVNGTFPTAASPRSTSLTLLLGFGVFAVDSDMTGYPKKEKGTKWLRSNKIKSSCKYSWREWKMTENCKSRNIGLVWAVVQLGRVIRS